MNSPKEADALRLKFGMERTEPKSNLIIKIGVAALLTAVCCGVLAIALKKTLFAIAEDSNTVNVSTNSALKKPISGKPVVLSSDLPNVNRNAEAIGDKLAAAAMEIRQRRFESALRNLAQAKIQAGNPAASDNQEAALFSEINAGIQQAETFLRQGKPKEAHQQINILLHKLDAPQF